ncbi:MAG: Xaa-Pro peptidase family protein [Acidobacteria bacterium]|nr:Xaa-Pro peptidase family protein [Acidobacteriota bacterium]
MTAESPLDRARLPASTLLVARHARLRQRLDTLSLDALVVTCAPNIRYLSNHTGSAGVFVLTRDGAHLLVDFRYRDAVASLQRSSSACPDLVVRDVPASYDEALLECLGDLGASVVGFEAAHVPVATHGRWQRMAGARQVDVTFTATESIVEDARVVKDSFEIATLRDAAARLTGVARSALDAVRAGETEWAVAGTIDAAIRDAGYERPAFDTIVASGPNAARPHHHPGDRVLADGDLVVLDFGGVLNGYCCDLTRMASVGAPSSDARRLYDAVYDAHQAAIAAVRPGVESTAVDAAARSLLDSRGLGAAFGHSTGHGLGLDVHELPRIARARADAAGVRLEPGMVFTIEPGAYVPGVGGVRIEDDVLVTETGCDVLTAVPHGLCSR